MHLLHLAGPTLKHLLIYYRPSFCVLLYVLKTPGHVVIKMSTLCIQLIASSLCSWTRFCLLHASCKLVISSKNLLGLRFSCTTSGGIATFTEVKIDQWIQVRYDWFIHYEVFHLPVSLIVLVASDNQSIPMRGYKMIFNSIILSTCISYYFCTELISYLVILKYNLYKKSSINTSSHF